MINELTIWKMSILYSIFWFTGAFITCFFIEVNFGEHISNIKEAVNSILVVSYALPILFILSAETILEYFVVSTLNQQSSAYGKSHFNIFQAFASFVAIIVIFIVVTIKNMINTDLNSQYSQYEKISILSAVMIIGLFIKFHSIKSILKQIFLKEEK